MNDLIVAVVYWIVLGNFAIYNATIWGLIKFITHLPLTSIWEILIGSVNSAVKY